MRRSRASIESMAVAGLVGAAVLMGIIGGSASGADPASEVPEEIAQPLPFTPSTAAELRESYDQAVARMIEIIRKTSDPQEPPPLESVKSAMQVLGHYRATAAIEVLIAEIGYPVFQRREFAVPSGMRAYRPYHMDCPAIPALAEIGFPAVEPILQRIYAGGFIIRAMYVEVLMLMDERYAIKDHLRGIAERSEDAEFKRLVLEQVLPQIAELAAMPRPDPPGAGRLRQVQEIERYLREQLEARGLSEERHREEMEKIQHEIDLMYQHLRNRQGP